MILNNCPILVYGKGKSLPGIIICLLEAGHPIWFYEKEGSTTHYQLQVYFSLNNNLGSGFLSENFHPVSGLEGLGQVGLAIVVTPENQNEKIDAIKKLEQNVGDNALIAVNMDSYSLSVFQESALFPERIVGLNWTVPANTTLFLEIIGNKNTDPKSLSVLMELAKGNWKKDPYLLQNGKGIRSRMLAALLREAFYLIENGYVNVEDIDRACRNDAGYYLPFAGNCRYMDLMGTYLYGLVMKDLNPELSKESHLPGFFQDILENGGKGMENGKGFYTYTKKEIQSMEISFRDFSFQIRDLMLKYPFVHKPGNENGTLSNIN